MDEILDIVDENDEIVGQELWSKIYHDGLPENRFVRVINIFVFNDDESYDNAAKRGVKEELGLENEEIEFLGKLGQNDG